MDYSCTHSLEPTCRIIIVCTLQITKMYVYYTLLRGVQTLIIMTKFSDLPIRVLNRAGGKLSFLLLSEEVRSPALSSLRSNRKVD